jgi:hypothetical protein
MNWRRMLAAAEGRGKGERRGNKDTGLTNKRANNTGKVATVFVMCGIAFNSTGTQRKNIYVPLQWD